jgi:serine/threonine protein phosphatase PrpC
MAESIVILGSYHPEQGAIHTECTEDGRSACSISAGLVEKPNEDCVGAAVSGDHRLLALADGHWGAEAAEMSVQGAVELLSEIDPALAVEPYPRLEELYGSLSTGLLELARVTPREFPPETTLIVCWIVRGEAGQRLFWASIGDSFLYLHDPASGLRLLNQPRSCWLGARFRLSAERPTAAVQEDRFMGAERVPAAQELGMQELQPGQSLLLCSDGLLEVEDPTSQFAEADLVKTLAGSGTAEACAARLVQGALDRKSRDNVAVVLYRA